jgi:hypothetical protein
MISIISGLASPAVINGTDFAKQCCPNPTVPRNPVALETASGGYFVKKGTVVF